MTLYCDAENSCAEYDCDVHPTNLTITRAHVLRQLHAGHPIGECRVRYTVLLKLLQLKDTPYRKQCRNAACLKEVPQPAKSVRIHTSLSTPQQRATDL